MTSPPDAVSGAATQPIGVHERDCRCGRYLHKSNKRWYHSDGSRECAEPAPTPEAQIPDELTIESAINFLEQSRVWDYADEVRGLVSAYRVARTQLAALRVERDNLKSMIESADFPDGCLIYTSDHEKILARDLAAARTESTQLRVERDQAWNEGWISIEDRLPEPGLNVIGICVGTFSTSEHYTTYRTDPMVGNDFWTWRDSHYGHQLPWFTHWAPLLARPIPAEPKCEEK